MRLSVIPVALALLLSGVAARSDQPQHFEVEGQFVEGCSCNAPCPCELTGLAHGCQGVGAIELTGGTYEGVDLSGVKIAYATVLGQWVRLYVDSKEASQRHAARAFGRAAFKMFGKVEAIKDARIALKGSEGSYTLSVDGGKIMTLTTKPVLGGDKKTPLVYSNINNPLSSTVMQAKTVSGRFKDGPRSFTLKDSNSYFNPDVKSSGAN
jgi:hypothetical protein